MIYDEFIDNMEVKTKTQYEKMGEVYLFSYDEGIKESQTLNTEKLWYDKKALERKCFFQKADKSITSQKNKLVKAQGQRKALNPKNKNKTNSDEKRI